MHIVRAVSFKAASTLMFAIMGAQMRALGGAYPEGQVAFFRALFGLVPIVIVFAWRGQLRGALRTARPGDHLLRGMFSVVGTFCTVAALARLPLADFTAIAFLAPFITVIFAAIFLKEQVHAYRWSAVAVGFGGVILMLLPYMQDHVALTSAMTFGLLFAVANAFTAGGASIQIRRLTATETTSSIVIFMTLLVLFVSLLTLPFGWRMPATWHDVAVLAGIGVAGGLGQIFFTDSYRFAPASFLAPFDYTAMLWAFILGYWFFGEVPTLYVMLGAVVVASAGIFVILRERYLGLKRLRDMPVAAIATMADDEENPDAPVVDSGIPVSGAEKAA